MQQQQQRQQTAEVAARRFASGKKIKKFPKTTKDFLIESTFVDREDFLQHYDVGAARDVLPSDTNQAVYILYQHPSSIPDNYYDSNNNNSSSLLSVSDATKNCQSLNIILTKPQGGLHQCLAIIGQYESQHIYRMMRNREHKPIDDTLSLEFVPRNRKPNGGNNGRPPNSVHLKENWKQLSEYLTTILPMAEKEIRPIVTKIRSSTEPSYEKTERTAVIAMVSNLGQADLLINFVCNANQQKMDLNNVLVFCTDKETYDIATSLGLNAYYNDILFSNVPTKAAKAYGDRVFAATMWAKVASVHILQQVGCDVLFQDVDVIWNYDRGLHPLDLFRNNNKNNIPKEDETSSINFHEYDIIFSDDGGRSLNFAPYSGNTGFYFIRYNDRTMWLMTNLVYISGDYIKWSTYSHQHALMQIVSEHVMQYGLRVKTLSHYPLLLGGDDYHRKPKLIKDIYVDGSTSKPIVFHMCWTHNRIQKLKYMKQMGMWYVKDQCEHEGALQYITTTTAINNSINNNKNQQQQLQNSCCSIEPIIECGYADKPSIIPCTNSTKLDPKGKSFW